MIQLEPDGNRGISKRTALKFVILSIFEARHTNKNTAYPRKKYVVHPISPLSKDEKICN